MMVGQNPRVHVLAQPPQQRRRALNVGEQERESSHAESVTAGAATAWRRRGLARSAPRA